MCQCGFNNYNGCTTLMMGEVGNGGGYVCGRQRVWEFSVLSAQFCYKPKTTLKK